MKVQCSGCAARYAIDDEKLSGRSARIRCRRCGAAIVVRGEPREHFVLVGASQRGPLSRHELERAIRGGEVSREALVWHDGLGEWTALTDVPALAVCLPAEAPIGARQESSVLFSLGTLRDLASAPARPAAAAEGSGLIDIRALAHAPSPAPAPAIDLLAALGGPSAAVPQVSIPTPPAHERGPLALAMTALAVVAVVVAGGLALGRGTRGVEPPAAGSTIEPPRASSAVPAPVSPPDEPRANDLVAPASELAASSETADRTAEPTTRTDAPRAARPRDRGPRPSAPPRPPPATLVEARAEPTGLEGLLGRAAPPATEARPRLPEAPTREEVRRAMDALAPRVRACGAGSGDRALVRVVVAGETGRPRSVSVGGAEAGPDAGTVACIERVVREVELAPFARGSFTVSYPFVL